jgi:CDP-diacylglycerol--serine O-phosphatidyltransferase
LAQQALTHTEYVEELFGVFFTALGPETTADPARHYYAIEISFHNAAVKIYHSKIIEKIVPLSQFMKNKLFTLPNMVTLCNLACGCVATVVALRGGKPELVFWWVAAAAVFDFADGAVARLTGQYSNIGKELDSLADVVSFGVAPSAALFALWGRSTEVLPSWMGFAVFMVALFSALRLAKFNIDADQQEEFSGLPTPAAALAITSLTAIWSGPSQWVILAVVACVSWLLVSPIRMFSLKFKNLAWHGNALRYTFLACSAVLIAVAGIGGVAACVGLYVAVSAVRHIKK